MKKAIDYLTAKPTRFFLLAALLWGGLMCYLNSKDGPNFHWHDLLVEANGMVFDLLVFGVLLSIYESLRSKNERIERFKEEIDDYRGWDEKEAAYRIAGVIKRLNKENINSINLDDCYLPFANLSEVNLKDSHLVDTNLSNADLPGSNISNGEMIRTNFIKANLSKSNLTRANLYQVNLMGAIMKDTDLSKAYLKKVNLREAFLCGANFSGAELEDIELDNATVEHDWFNKMETWEVQGITDIKKRYVLVRITGNFYNLQRKFG